MIISHKHRFIFFKAPKTAGTSVEIALSTICGEEDVLTRVTRFDPKFDSDSYVPIQKNAALGMSNHTKPFKVREVVGEEVWRNYFRFAIVRNPWDRMVSEYYWKYRNQLDEIHQWKMPRKKRHFAKFLGEGEKSDYEMFFFLPNGELTCDYYLRFERLSEDWNLITSKFAQSGLELHKSKDKVREREVHYSKFYSPLAKEIVTHRYSEVIKVFGYSFEDA